jgi:hypothetical protein
VREEFYVRIQVHGNIFLVAAAADEGEGEARAKVDDIVAVSGRRLT